MSKSFSTTILQLRMMAQNKIVRTTMMDDYGNRKFLDFPAESPKFE